MTLRSAIAVGAGTLAAAGALTLVVREWAISPEPVPLATDQTPLAAVQAPDVPEQAPVTTEPPAHFDHATRHGGLVLMNGDTHFEVVLDHEGGYRVYFSDGSRGPLPGSFASQVQIVATRPGGAGEGIALAIDPTGSHWVGQGSPIDDPNTVVRMSYAAGATDYWIDVPASAWGIAILPAETPPSR